MEFSDGPRRPGRFARPRLYQQLADHISSFIEAQGLAPGDRLPPERALAAELGVSRATLSRALVALEVAGRVEVRHGDGAVVRGPLAPPTLVESLSEYSPDDLADLRDAVMGLLVGKARGCPHEERARVLELFDGGAAVDNVWAAVRDLAGPGLAVDLDVALDAAGARLGADQRPALRSLCAPLWDDIVPAVSS